MAHTFRFFTKYAEGYCGQPSRQVWPHPRTPWPSLVMVINDGDDGDHCSCDLNRQLVSIDPIESPWSSGQRDDHSRGPRLPQRSFPQSPLRLAKDQVEIDLERVQFG